MAEPDPDRRSLTPAQRETAADLGWYRRWLEANGRSPQDYLAGLTSEELDEQGSGHG